MVALLVRLFFLLLVVGLIVAVVYRIGKRLGWWGDGVHTTNRPPRQRPRPRPGVSATVPAAKAMVPTPETPHLLVADLWRRVTTMKAGVWRVTRGDKRLRFWVVGSIAAADAVLHLERVTEPAQQTATVEVFTFRRNTGQPELRRVTVSTVEEEVLPVHLGQEFATALVRRPEDDDLRRLRTDLSMSMEPE